MYQCGPRIGAATRQDLVGLAEFLFQFLKLTSFLRIVNAFDVINQECVFLHLKAYLLDLQIRPWALRSVFQPGLAMSD
jgi:hypothetical protein